MGGRAGGRAAGWPGGRAASQAAGHLSGWLGWRTCRQQTAEPVTNWKNFLAVDNLSISFQ